MMDDMARNVDRTVGKSPGIVRLSAIRGRQRAPLHGYAGKQTRSWRPKGSESRGTTGCCIRSKSSWLLVHAIGEGKGDVDAMVAALEGFEFDGPKGTLTVRASDHALIQDMYQVKLVAEGGSFVPELVDTVPADEVAPAEQ